MISLFRLTNDAGRSATHARMLAGAGKVSQPPLGILLAKWSTAWLLRKA